MLLLQINLAVVRPVLTHFLFMRIWTFHTSSALLPMHDLALGTPGDPKSANIDLIQDENCPTAAPNACFKGDVFRYVVSAQERSVRLT